MKYQFVTYRKAALNDPSAPSTSTGDAIAVNTTRSDDERDERGREQPSEPAGVEAAEPNRTRVR